ncbi:MAG: HAMP domain-containing protein, partial [Gracilibacteraceae bacterium]|nr:HAMP domain-containing protein [Gracilibacteraceae bacterium]
MSRWEDITKRWGLTIRLAFFVFAIMVGTFVFAALIIAVLHRSGVRLFQFVYDVDTLKHGFSFLMTIMFCVLLGMVLTVFFSKIALNPIRQVIVAIHKVARGDFDVQVDLKGVGELEELSQSFNTMTRELSSIETLRSDFIDYFSHEFKTPIVSMRGFAKLLKDGTLSDGQRQEYLDIIIAESERLAELSTNVLNMSKYE